MIYDVSLKPHGEYGEYSGQNFLFIPKWPKFRRPYFCPVFGTFESAKTLTQRQISLKSYYVDGICEVKSNFCDLKCKLTFKMLF